MRRSPIAIVLLCTCLAPLAAQDQGPYWNRWEAAVKANDWKKAELVAREALRLFPDDVNFAGSLANALGRQSRAAEAVAFIEPHFTRRPTVPRLREALAHALLAVGWKHYETGARAAALAPFSRAFALLPEDRSVLNAYGCVLRDTGRVDEALPLLEKGYRGWPDDTYLKPNLVHAYVVKANQLAAATNARAAAFFAKAGALDATSEAYLLNYGGWLDTRHRHREALVLFEECLRRHPANAWVRGNIQHALQEEARALAETGDVAGALAKGTAAAARYPGETWFMNDCAGWAIRLERWAEAERWLVALATTPALLDYGKPLSYPREDLVRHRLSSVCWKYAERREVPRAFALLDRVARGFPGALFVEELRGVLTFHAGRVEEGIALVNRVYDRYIRGHADLAVPLLVELPVRGTLMVWGNNRTESVTHAGMSRFCFDFLGADESGATRKPGTENPGRNEDYWGFGRDVLAAADGVVESVTDAYPDIAPRLTPSLGDGNAVTVKDAAGRHFVYVHNKQGSATVKVGQAVKAGQKLAELGNTGYTIIAHLHFGVYSPDWRVSMPVKFVSYSLRKDGAWIPVTGGVPGTGDVISR